MQECSIIKEITLFFCKIDETYKTIISNLFVALICSVLPASLLLNFYYHLEYSASDKLISILYSVLIGLFGGVLSTIAMTISEIPSWKKWGLPGVFEWHENQIITIRLFHISDTRHIHFKGIFLFHFLNGVLAGISFPFITSFLTSVIHYTMPFSVLGILYSIVL